MLQINPDNKPPVIPPANILENSSSVSLVTECFNFKLSFPIC